MRIQQRRCHSFWRFYALKTAIVCSKWKIYLGRVYRREMAREGRLKVVHKRKQSNGKLPKAMSGTLGSENHVCISMHRALKSRIILTILLQGERAAGKWVTW